MKSPKEKAKELVDKFEYPSEQSKGNIWAKQCALICVDEILELTKFYAPHISPIRDHWQEVKKELQKSQ